MKRLLPLVAFIGLTLALAGCQSPSVQENWPYNGPPMVGTNTIPVPQWGAK